MLTGTTVTAGELVATRRHATWVSRPPSRPGHAAAPTVGQGTEFRELRDYAPGDDPRHIDWRATGRTGQPLTRVLETQRDTTWLHIIALTPGMYFGSRSAYKSVRALELAAQTGWQCIDSGDRIGTVIGSSHGVEVQPPTGQGQRFAGYLAAWAAHSELPGPGLPALEFPALVARARQAAQRAQIVVVWGDFLPGPAWPALLDPLSRKSVVLVQVADPLEQQLPEHGEFSARGDAGFHRLTGSSDTALRYRESRQRWLDSLLRAPHRAHFDWWQCSTARPALYPAGTNPP